MVHAAAEVITDRGVTAATFDAIGARSGYHRSLVTQRFGSKRGLIDAVIDHLKGAFAADDLDRRADQLSGLDGLILLQDTFLIKLASSNEIRAYFMLMASAAAELGELRIMFATLHEEGRDRWVGLITKGQADGSIDSGIDPQLAAPVVGSLRVGVVMQLLVDPFMDLDAVRLAALDTLRRGLGAKQMT